MSDSLNRESGESGRKRTRTLELAPPIFTKRTQLNIENRRENRG
jgi:hypothetical protein